MNKKMEIQSAHNDVITFSSCPCFTCYQMKCFLLYLSDILSIVWGAKATSGQPVFWIGRADSGYLQKRSDPTPR